MKFRNILLSVAAAALAIAGCKEPEPVPVVDPEVEINTDIADLDPSEQSFTIQLTSTIDWQLKDYTSEVKSWVTVNPESGKGSESAQPITISVTANTGADRTADITFYGNKAYNATLKINQKGDKGDASEITVAEFIQKADTQNPYILSGKVSGFNANYCSFDLTDDSGKIYVYSIAESSKEKASTIKNGGIVKIKGYYDFFETKKQHEVINAEILSYEAPMAIDPSKIETITVKEFLDKADASTPYRLVGTVSGFNATYCSFNLKDDTGTIYIYSIDEASKAAFADKLANGKKVTLYGTYYWYENADPSKSKAEINPATVEKVEDGDDGGSADYNNAPAKTVEEFISAADRSTYYKLTGTVSGFNANYCSFDLTDNTGKIYVYSVANKSEWSSKISNGGKVTIAGLYDYYEAKSQHEVVNAYILSFTTGDDGGDTPPTPGPNEPTTWTEVTVKEFIAKPVNTTDWYQLTGTITNIAKADYGNFYIQDAAGDQLYVYGMTSKWVGSNDKSFASLGLAVGDIVTFRTLRSEYNGEPQAGGNSVPAYYISHEKGKPVEVPAGSITLTFPDDNKTANAVNGYDDVWTAKAGSNSFTMVQFNNYQWNNWTYVRCGRKKASVASITTDNALASKIASVAVNIDSVTGSDVNSITLNVASDAGFSTVVASVPVTDVKAGELKFAVPADKQAAGLYYQVVFDCKASSASKNGFVQVSKLVFLAAE